LILAVGNNEGVFHNLDFMWHLDLLSKSKLNSFI
jgi:hypothetical protein